MSPAVLPKGLLRSLQEPGIRLCSDQLEPATEAHILVACLCWNVAMNAGPKVTRTELVSPFCAQAFLSGDPPGSCGCFH
jgi:hypothetical protein